VPYGAGMGDVGDGGRVVVAVPGRMFGPHAPLLMFTADAAEARGARLRPFWWDGAEELDIGDPEAVMEWARKQVDPVVDEVVGSAESVLLAGKSLGVNAAAVAAEREIPAVWLTPALVWPPIVEALRRATAPFLLVGGTGDQAWDSRLAHELTPYVLEVEGADHGMYVPGPLAASAAVLGRVATAVEDFLDEVVWPVR
jgi:hypothetical protein